jgi:hypothetical protein
MNYITQLSRFYQKVYTDERFTPHHISLYSGIFQLWNSARFQNPIQVSRQDLMKLSKIGSANTYIRCMQQLDQWQYIQYFPSRNVSIGSRIRIIIFDNSTDNSSETALRHLNKQNKNNTNIPTIEQVSAYFETEHFPKEQALLFFNHNTAKGWMMGSSPILNWQAAAVNWVAKQTRFERSDSISTTARRKGVTMPDSNSVATTKNYHEPL